MNQLFSASWYRVASLKPELPQNIEINRQEYDGKIWYVIHNKYTNRFHRFNDKAYSIIGLINGKSTIQEIWQLNGLKLGDNAISQDELINLLIQLHNADLIECNILPNIESIIKKSNQKKKNKWYQQLSNPISVKIPLIDPENFLNKHIKKVSWLFNKKILLIWFIIFLTALILGVYNSQELTNNIVDKTLSINNILLMIIIYPIVKLIHELGHAFATKNWGGEVHEMGIVLLALFPIPYVNASTILTINDKYKRMVVSSIGIMIELFLASIALFIWLNVASGVISAICFNIIFLCSVSTLLFNGNPLLRYDSYYLLIDYIEIPNLASRSKKYLSYLFHFYILKDIQQIKISTSSREKNGFSFMVFYRTYTRYLFTLLLLFTLHQSIFY